MSKIIKAFEGSPVAEYDFRTLEKELTKGSLRGFFSAGNSGAWNGRQDDELNSSAMFDEVEAAIQSRLLELERKAQEMEKEAYEKGYAQGERDGFEFGRKSMLVVKERLERLLSKLESAPERVFKDYRNWFISACMAVTRRMVGMELETKPQALTRLVDALLDEAEAHQSLTLYLHPKDLELLTKSIDLKQWTRDSKHPFLIKTDRMLDRGGFRLESDSQYFDASLETQFSLLEQALRNNEPIGHD